MSRRPTDTYYKNEETVLRPHTSVHQIPTMKQGHTDFLVAGDVYRKDTVDKTHYPVFHQMEGVRTYTLEELKPFGVKDIKEAKIVSEKDLKQTLENLAKFVFGDVEMRWNPDNFPFTDPSLELEIYYNNEWLEILGSGVILDGVMLNAQKDIKNEVGYAFGLGLERWAMKLFEIPDIRLFWTEDSRFKNQFASGDIVKFKPYSKYPACYKDVTFWIPENFNENNFHELVRGVAGDLVESVELIDDFTNKKLGKRSNCFRINYRDMNRSLTNEEVDKLQFQVRDKLVAKLGCELR